MPLALQVKLLRAIETRSIERLGSNVAVPLDIRFVAASKADLQAACRAGQFREDLYYRLNVVSLTIPPLRERRRSEEHTSELQSLMRISYAVFCLKKKNNN